MKLKLKLASFISLLGLSSFSGLIAQDALDVKIYGKVQASVAVLSQSEDTAAGEETTAGLHVSSNDSRFGLKGEIAATDSLTGFFKIEIQTDIADNTKSSADFIKSRNAYVGLKGDAWGSVLWGRHDSPYKKAQMKSDLFNDTLGDYDGVMGRTSGGAKAHTRESNIIYYKTPDFIDESLSFALALVPSDTVIDSGDNDDDMLIGANAIYNNKDMGLSLSFALQYETGGHNDISTADEAGFAVRLVAGYNFLEAHQVWFLADLIDSDNDADTRTAFNLGYKFSFEAFSTGTSSIRANISVALESDQDNADDDAMQFTVGFFQTFNKHIELYTVASYLGGGDNAAYKMGKGDAISLNGNEDSIFGLAFGCNITF